MSGDADELKGRAKRAVGEATDDPKLKRDGALDKAAGKLKSGIDKLRDRAQRH